MKANRWFFTNDAGMTWPSSSLQLRLVVEQFQLARAAGHEQEDHALGLGRENAADGASGLVRRSAVRSGEEFAVAQERRQRDGAKPTPQSAKKCRRVVSELARIFGYRILGDCIRLIPA